MLRERQNKRVKKLDGGSGCVKQHLLYCDVATSYVSMGESIGSSLQMLINLWLYFRFELFVINCLFDLQIGENMDEHLTPGIRAV